MHEKCTGNSRPLRPSERIFVGFIHSFFESFLTTVPKKLWSLTRGNTMLRYAAIMAGVLLLSAQADCPAPTPTPIPEVKPVPTPVPPDPIACSGAAIAAGSTVAQIQAKVNASASGTVFCFAPGIYVLTGLITLKEGTQMICTARRACILTGQDKYRGGFASPWGLNHQVIRGFVAEHFTHLEGSWPISPFQVRTGGIVEDNESRYNYQGMDVSSGNIVRGNLIHHNARYGIAGGPGIDILIEDNELSFNNTGKFDFGDAGGSKVVGSRNLAGMDRLTWRGNYVHDNYGVGIWSDGNVKNVTYEDNRVENNFLAGIFHEISWTATIKNNTLKGNSTGQGDSPQSCWHEADIALNNSQNVEITGNLVESALNRNPLCLVSADRPSTSLAAFPSSTKNVYVHGNTFKTRGSSQLGYVGVVAADNIDFVGNTYYSDDLARKGWAYYAYPITLAQWKTQGQDLGGVFIKW